MRLPSSLRIAWRQISHSKIKLVVAAAGVVVAVMLMLVQLGIREGAIDSSVAIAKRITAEIVVISPRTRTIFQPSPMPRRLTARLLADAAVDRVEPLYVGQARLKNPWTNVEFPTGVYALEPEAPMMNLPGYAERSREVRLPDRALFDSQSRLTYGPIAAEVAAGRPLSVEVNYRRVAILDTIAVGVSINADGNLFTTPANFLRMFPGRDPGAIDVGLVRLRDPAAAPEVARRLGELLGSEARVMTREELIAAEVLYLREIAPLDFIFGMGAAVGFFIGFVVVYQILYTEVMNHLPHYATLKAMGFADAYLRGVVLSQACILSVLGYVPGFALAIGVYAVATRAIQMPIAMTFERAALVFTFTLVMCGLSGLVALRRIAGADPADVF
jgi:putative ABC transport system permease protein